MNVYNNILELVGNTPMVRINKLNPNPNVELLAKLEWYNPLGSVKERLALYMIERAKENGELTPDKTIIESSSGNTGIGLALVGAIKGYKVAITMSAAVSEERRAVMKALGAEIITTSKEGGSDEAWDKADQLFRDQPEKYARLHQYKTPYNAEVHERYTSQEIWQQTDGRITALVGTLGTTGTIVGCSRGLKKLNPDIRVFSVEPQPGKHRQMGIRNVDSSRTPDIWDPRSVDERLVVHDDEALKAARDLIRWEGLFGGISCGSALVGAQMVARDMKEGVVVTIFPDHAYKYLSTELFEGV